MATQTMTISRTVEAKVNYFPNDAPKTAYPGTAGYQRRKFDTRLMQISDIRGKENEFHLDTNGFQVIKHEIPQPKIDATDAEVKKTVYPETIKVLKQVTGATDVHPFSHQIRCHSAQEIQDMANGLQDSEVLRSAGPTQYVHCDNSEEGAVPVLRENLSPGEFERRKKSHWAIMNIWFPIERAVTREPLALLDAQSVAPSDFVGVWASLPRPGQGAFDNVYNAGEGFEIAQVRASAEHRWHYASNLGVGEALVFKQYDSKRDGRARQTPHCAFQSSEDNGPTRQSIEMRCLVFWEGRLWSEVDVFNRPRGDVSEP